MDKNRQDNPSTHRPMQYNLVHPGHEWDAAAMHQSQTTMIQSLFGDFHDRAAKHTEKEIARGVLQDNQMAMFRPDANAVDPKLRNTSEDYLTELLRKYNNALINKGIILSYKDIKSKNMIDIRKLVDEQNSDPAGMPVIYDNNNNRHEFIDKTGWLSIVPCFSEAVIRLNTFRYLYYKVMEIHPNEKNIKIYLHDYTYRQGDFLTNCFGTIIMEAVNNSSFVAANIESVKLTPDIYRMVSKEELHWSKYDYDTWEEVLLKYADETLAFLQNRYDTTQFHELIKAFSVIISTINNQLYLHKPSRPTGASSGKKHQTVIEPKDAHEKVVRKVGIISVKSEKPPKLVTAQTVTKYKVAEWTTRGFIRTYKSGKQVHVRESIHHRKALQDKTNTPVKQQQVIKFVNKKDT